MATEQRLTVGGIIRLHREAESCDIFVPDPRQPPAAEMLKGRFPDTEELTLIGKHLPADARIIEIGAGIGAHTVYFERVLKCRGITVLEDDPEKVRALGINIRLNGLRGVDTRFLGRAATEVVGDGSLEGLDADFIKIRGTGEEMRILSGLGALIGRSKPLIFIELHSGNEAAFLSWLTAGGYEIIERHKRHAETMNYLLRRT